MSIQWPAGLVQELADRRALIVLGAGASRTCVGKNSSERFPAWDELLMKLAVPLKTDDRSAFDEMIKRSRLLDAAQLVRDGVEKRILDDSLLSIFSNPHIKPSSLYEYVNLIDQPVVLTTNYDRMYELYWQDLVTSSPDASQQLIVATRLDDGIIDNLRASRRLLVKVHGTIDKHQRLVLSRGDYSRARTENARFYQVVSALMLTHTMLFIGSGFNGDPDMDLLLEDAAFAAKSEYPHYALLPQGKHSSEIRTMRSAFNVQAVEYEVRANHDHSAMLEALKDLADLVVDARV